MELSEWASNDRLVDWVSDATDRMLGQFDDFTNDDPRWLGPYLPIVNPPIWEIGHVAWFAEWFVLRQLHGRGPIMDGVDARYDSAAVPHITRWHLSYPDAVVTKDYVRRVADGLIEVLQDDRGLDSTAYFTAYAISHYDAHNEAFTYSRQTLEWGAPTWAVDPVPTVMETTGDRPVGGGTLVLGASREQPFVMDNEKWAHAVDVEPFAMAGAPVTMAEFAQFVDDGGYSNADLWSAEGWVWRNETGAEHPVYWREANERWEHRRFDKWRGVSDDAHHPMTHVSWWEADAFCSWAGRRLPTEREWEMAATTGPAAPRRPWFPWGDRDPEADEAALGAQTAGTVPVGAHASGDGPWGHRQLIGNVWEWTASTFLPYPHFEPDAYRDNSEPWFHSRKVLRGGSWATQPRYVRSTFRNYFTPDRRDVIAGFRTCALR